MVSSNKRPNLESTEDRHKRLATHPAEYVKASSLVIYSSDDESHSSNKKHKSSKTTLQTSI